MSEETAGGQGIPQPEGPTNIIETEYEIGQDNIQPKLGPFGLDIHNPVFVISGLTIVAFVILTLAFQNDVEPLFEDLRGWLTSNLAWFFLSAGNIFVIMCLVLIVTPLGSVRIGGKDATPDYGYLGWFAMLFAAGMGIGLMFFGVSEPLSHYNSALAGTTVENGVRTDWAPLGAAAGDSAEAQRLGMAATIFHWGLHPWAIYAVGLLPDLRRPGLGLDGPRHRHARRVCNALRPGDLPRDRRDASGRRA